MVLETSSQQPLLFLFYKGKVTNPHFLCIFAS